MIWFISDAHFGHKNIHKFGSRPIESQQDNEDWIADFWQVNVSGKRNSVRADIVFCLGDMAFDAQSLKLVRSLNGRKVLIRGNHDAFVPELEREVYERVEGLCKYKNFRLSHAPIHEQELRGSHNAHGHVHAATVPDPRYLNLCADSLHVKFGKPMINLDELREWSDSNFSPLQA